jgi:hypothetical protein
MAELGSLFPAPLPADPTTWTIADLVGPVASGDVSPVALAESALQVIGVNTSPVVLLEERLRISWSSRSEGLFDQIWRQTSLGKAVKASTSARAASGCVAAVLQQHLGRVSQVRRDGLICCGYVSERAPLGLLHAGAVAEPAHRGQVALEVVQRVLRHATHPRVRPGCRRCHLPDAGSPAGKRWTHPRRHDTAATSPTRDGRPRGDQRAHEPPMTRCEHDAGVVVARSGATFVASTGALVCVVGSSPAVAGDQCPVVRLLRRRTAGATCGHPPRPSPLTTRWCVLSVTGRPRPHRGAAHEGRSAGGIGADPEHADR